MEIDLRRLIHRVNSEYSLPKLEKDRRMIAVKILERKALISLPIRTISLAFAVQHN